MKTKCFSGAACLFDLSSRPSPSTNPYGNPNPRPSPDLSLIMCMRRLSQKLNTGYHIPLLGSAMTGKTSLLPKHERIPALSLPRSKSKVSRMPPEPHPPRAAAPRPLHREGGRPALLRRRSTTSRATSRRTFSPS